MPYTGKGTLESVDGHIRHITDFAGTVDIGGTAVEARATIRSDDNGPTTLSIYEAIKKYFLMKQPRTIHLILCIRKDF
jgi:hypothetical protein